ncbi:MAG: carbohydrate kinase family protein [Clostridia bacterium]|nr:carbohydrate kinase family protein [Clostridia bacterium]
MQDNGYIVVVGGINMDIFGTSDTKLLPGDSNPGRVESAPGGVGRNIAENLCRMGCRTAMLTVLGDDSHAAAIRESSAQLNLDLSHAITIPGRRTGTYLCVNDSDGDVTAAIADMGIYDLFTPDVIAPHMDWLNKADMVIVDANLPEESITYIAENCTAPLACDPVSVKKAGKFKPSLGHFITLKPNRPEAQLLTGVAIDGLLGLDQAGQAMLDMGVKRVFISLGSQGVYYTDGEVSGIQPCKKGTILNTTGCGDAFIAAAVLGYTKGMSIREMAAFGQAASSVCAEADAAVNPDTTFQTVMERMEE